MDAQPSQELRQLIQKVSGGATLSEDEIRTALEQMTAGAATPAQMGAFLMALRVRGETVEEIAGAAQMLRDKMNGVEVVRRTPSTSSARAAMRTAPTMSRPARR